MNATTSTMMPLFGLAHLIPIALLLGVIGFFIYARMSSIQAVYQDKIGQGLAWILFFNFPIYLALQIFDGSVTWDTALPLYPCPLASLMAPWLVHSRNQTLLNVIFYWVFAGTLQAVITPEIYSSFPHYEYLYFWVCHAGLLALICFLLINQEREPTNSGILTAFGWFNVMLAISAVVNVLTGSNYYYLRAKPSVPTLIDYLGPWPWYILGVEAVALVFFVLSFGVFWVVKNKLLLPSRDHSRTVLPAA